MQWSGASIAAKLLATGPRGLDQAICTASDLPTCTPCGRSSTVHVWRRVASSRVVYESGLIMVLGVS